MAHAPLYRIVLRAKARWRIMRPTDGGQIGNVGSTALPVPVCFRNRFESPKDVESRKPNQSGDWKSVRKNENP
jgi:hypothetical protein